MGCKNPAIDAEQCEMLKKFIVATQIGNYVNISTFSIITFANFYYLITRILKLEKKSFHLMMFSLL